MGRQAQVVAAVAVATERMRKITTPSVVAMLARGLVGKEGRVTYKLGRQCRRCRSTAR